MAGKRPNKTGHRGAYKASGNRTCPYRATYMHHGVSYYLGSFKTAQEAGQRVAAHRLKTGRPIREKYAW